MRSLAKASVSSLIAVALIIVVVVVMVVSGPSWAADVAQPIDIHPVDSTVTQIGSAESRSLNRFSDYDPNRQPEIYWHDSDYRVDLMLPYSAQHPYLITILPKQGQRKEVELSGGRFDFGAIVSITRGPKDKAVVVGQVDGNVEGFSIVDLKTGHLVDTVYGYAPSVSLGGRFVIFEALYPPHSSNAVESHYRLYDVLKTPLENTCCGYQKLDDWRGQAIYPVSAGEICRPSEDPDAESKDLHWGASDGYAWSPDSSAVAFADTQGSVMSIILVTMPTALNFGASTFIYTLPNQGKLCAENCTRWEPVHLTWVGDVVSATIKFTPFGGKLRTWSLALRKTDFAPTLK